MVYVFTRVLWFPDNTVIAWIKDNYHEQGNIIIMLLLLPLGHISNIKFMEKWSNAIRTMTWCRQDWYVSNVASLSSRQLLLPWLSLPLSDKVNQLHGDCISYNKETTIRLLSVADNFYKTWSSHTIMYITSCLDHITSQHALQKQVRRPLLCCCKFYVASMGF